MSEELLLVWCIHDNLFVFRSRVLELERLEKWKHDLHFEERISHHVGFHNIE